VISKICSFLYATNSTTNSNSKFSLFQTTFLKAKSPRMVKERSTLKISLPTRAGEASISSTLRTKNGYSTVINPAINTTIFTIKCRMRTISVTKWKTQMKIYTNWKYKIKKKVKNKIRKKMIKLWKVKTAWRLTKMSSKNSSESTSRTIARMEVQFPMRSKNCYHQILLSRLIGSLHRLAELVALVLINKLMIIK